MAAFPVPAGSMLVVPGGPDNSLPGAPPGYWGGVAPPTIDNTLPPPPGIWPPPVSIWPPVELPPGYPMPPGSIWPPVVSGGPIVPPDAPARPDQGLPTPPAQPDHGLPSQKFLVAIVAVSAGGGLQVVGYTVVDPSLSVGLPLPPVHGHPDQGLPPAPARPAQPIAPTPEPRR